MTSPSLSNCPSPSAKPTSDKKRGFYDDNFSISKRQATSHSQFKGKNALSSKETIEECIDKNQLFEIFQNLERNNIELEEKLHKLQVVKQHHSKIIPDDLVSLTEKWLITAQSAIIKLYDKFPEPKPNDLLALISKLRINPAVVKYDPDHHRFPSE